jgi:hypothetical protein
MSTPRRLNEIERLTQDSATPGGVTVKNPQSADITHSLALWVLEQESVSRHLPINADCFMVTKFEPFEPPP